MVSDCRCDVKEEYCGYISENSNSCPLAVCLGVEPMVPLQGQGAEGKPRRAMREKLQR
jgi:hypothetical protein